MADPLVFDENMRAETIAATARYAGKLSRACDVQTGIAILIENIRGLSLAMGCISDHETAATLLESLAKQQRELHENRVSFEKRYPEPYPVTILPCVRIEREEPNPSAPHSGPNVVEFSERYRNSRKANT